MCNATADPAVDSNRLVGLWRPGQQRPVRRYQVEVFTQHRSIQYTRYTPTHNLKHKYNTLAHYTT